MSETVLVVGATGNVGVSAVIGALKAGKKVLAIVRNDDSAAKLFKEAGTKEGITTVQADVTKPDGVKGVVDQARAGKLPAFQHVYASVGGSGFFAAPLHEQSLDFVEDAMTLLFKANLYAYKAVIPYLLEQAPADTSFTVCVGGALDLGYGGPVPATQGALLGLANAAAFDLKGTNVRVIEAWLNTLVRFDDEAAKQGGIPSSEYARVYQTILNDTSLKGVRSDVTTAQDVQKMRFEQKQGTAPPKNVENAFVRLAQD